MKYVVVQSLSCVQLFAVLWTAAHYASLSFTISQILLKLMSIEFMVPSTISSSVTSFFSFPQSFPASGSFPMSQFFAPGGQSIRAFNISPSDEYSGLISFRIDGFDLLSVQGTLKSILQHHSTIASILRRSAFFTVQLSQPYMTTGKTVALTRRTLVGK